MKVPFDVVWAQRSPQTFSICMRFTKDVDDAQDLFQNTYIKARTSYETFNEALAIATWLWQVCRSCYVDNKRLLRNRFTPLSLQTCTSEETNWDVEDTKSVSIDRTLVIKEAVSLLKDKMDPNDFNLIVLRAQGIAWKDIAKIVKITEPAAKSRIHRARKRAKEILASYETS